MAFSKPFADVGFGSRCANQLLEIGNKAAFSVLAYCFMPDHVHLLVEGRAEHADLKKFISAFKQQTGFAHKKATGNTLWQVSYYDRTLRSEDDLQVLADYVFMNPVKAGLVSDPYTYPLSGGSYFSRRPVDVVPEPIRSPEASADRAEAAVPTSDGAANGAASHPPVSNPEASADRAEAAVPTSDGAANGGVRHPHVSRAEATGDRAEAAIPASDGAANGVVSHPHVSSPEASAGRAEAAVPTRVVARNDAPAAARQSLSPPQRKEL
jgi:REP element-mobilizing transposase RayT